MPNESLRAQPPSLRAQPPSLRAQRSNLTSLSVALLIVLHLCSFPTRAADACFRQYAKVVALVTATGVLGTLAGLGIFAGRDHAFEVAVVNANSKLHFENWSSIEENSNSEHSIRILAENWIRGKSKTDPTSVNRDFVRGVCEALENIRNYDTHPDWNDKVIWSASDRANLRREVIFLLRRDRERALSKAEGARHSPSDLHAVLEDASMYRKVRSPDILKEPYLRVANSMEVVYRLAVWAKENREDVSVLAKGLSACEEGVPQYERFDPVDYLRQVDKTVVDGFHDSDKRTLAIGALPHAVELYIQYRKAHDNFEIPTLEKAIQELLELGKKSAP